MKNSNSGLSIYPQASTENIVVQQLHDETLIYNITTHQAFCLNPTAAFVWNSCDGRTSVSEIAEQLSNKTNHSADEEVVWLALNQLQKENLIIENNSVSSHFGGLSRREVIKKVGLASLIALPIVSGIVAPPAIMAQSSCPGGAAGGQPTTVSGNVATLKASCASCCYRDFVPATQRGTCCTNCGQARCQ